MEKSRREPALSTRLRALIAHPEDGKSIGASQRLRRWAMLGGRFPAFDQMRVLDLGGTSAHWLVAPARPAAVVVLNLLPETSSESWITTVQGDACVLPASLAGEHFDLVYSNSVIEHVGGHARRIEFAATVHSFSSYRWIQTPYRYFPIEPHWIFPGLQFLPANVKAATIGRWPLSPARPKGRQALSDVLETELLTGTQMRFYFPTSEIVTERVLYATKSLIATG